MSPALDTPSRWPHRIALWTVWAVVPLLLLGGTVTTLRAGMVIQGWWILEPGSGDHFLFFYPIEKWFRSMGSFSEHSHRLFGALVGLLSILYAIVAWRSFRDPLRRWMAIAGFLAVSAQGTLGGLRVLANAQELALIHGSFAQLAFAVLVSNAVLSSPSWGRAGTVERLSALELRRMALIACVLVYVQIAFGAWLRHTGSALAMSLHVLLVLFLIGSVLRLAAQLAQSGHPSLTRLAAHLKLFLWLQVGLGVLAAAGVFVFSGGFRAEVSSGELIFATLHVAGGALLFVTTTSALLWTSYLAGAGAETRTVSVEGLEVAR